MKSVRITAFCFSLFVFTTFAWTTEIYFEVIDNEGNNFVGTVTALDRTKAALQVNETSHTIPLEKIVKIRNLALNPYQVSSSSNGDPDLLQQLPSAPMSTTRGENERKTAANLKILQSDEQAASKALPNNIVVLELKDGSRLTASSFTVAKSYGNFRLLDQPNDCSLPLTSMATVRFMARSLSEIVHPPADWLRLAVPHAEGDKLIVGNAGSFDVYTGILDHITAETIAFSIDDEVLPVPRRKVFGLVLHNESPSVGEPPLGTLSLWAGTQGMISDLRLKGNELTWQTVTGLNVTVPLEMVEEIDFGEKGVAYLADLELVRSEFSLPFESDVNPAQLPLLKAFYESRSKKLSGNAMLDGIVYEQSITLKGKTLLEYRLPKPFSLMKAVIGIEDQYRPYASATLKILADSQILGTWELRGDAASEPILLNLPQHCRLLTIIAEPLPLSDVPTMLTIGEPKLFE